ncbi:hypothetical protein CL654_03485 [bacterium]|nr:hypothetical protein [bacterium]|tara:strand:- start:7413 stop:7985 length:573 start_codon:yes stop_codon:yes gene_type:complete
MFEWIDIKTLLTIAHLFGVALGVGGAFASDGIFLKSIKDQRITKTELGFIVFGSTMVWTGLFLLILSGLGLFLLDPTYYLASSKFLAKMTIVLILTINGIIFHISHIPRFLRHVDEFFHSSDEFMRKRWLILSSGALSLISWGFALVLGVFSSVPYSYITIMAFYIGVLVISILIALALKKRILPDHRKH